MRSEPAALIGALEAAVISVLTLIAVALELDADLTAAIVGVGAAAVALIGALITRSRVTPYVELDE